MTTHSFDIEIAQQLGINAAILLRHIGYWVQKNKANGECFHDGYYWTYSSYTAFADIFPYLGLKQIRTALARLKDAGFIITGNYNTYGRKNVIWYALTAEGETLLYHSKTYLSCQNGSVTGDETESEPCQNGKQSLPKRQTIPVETASNPCQNDNVSCQNGTIPCQNDKPKNNMEKRYNNNYISVSEKDKETDKNKNKAYINLINEYAGDDDELRKLLFEWCENRKAKRAPLTEQAMRRNLQKLKAFANESGMSETEYLKEIVRLGWQSFFAIRPPASARQTQSPQQTGMITRSYSKEQLAELTTHFEDE